MGWRGKARPLPEEMPVRWFPFACSHPELDLKAHLYIHIATLNLASTRQTRLNLSTPTRNQITTASLSELEVRRSFYPLTKDLPASLTKASIEGIITETIKHTPSPYNSQFNRAVLLLGAEHDKVWDITAETLKAIVPEDSWAPTAERWACSRPPRGR